MANMPPPPPGFTLDSSNIPPPPSGFKLDALATANKPKESAEPQYTGIHGAVQKLGSLFPESITPMDISMIIPSLGGEGALLKGGQLLENAATRASPKIAQSLGEGKLLPFLSNVGKVSAAGAGGGAVYGAGTGGDIKGSAEVGGIGSLGGQALGKVIGKGYDAFKNFIGSNAQETVNNKATQKVLAKFQKDEKAGGISAEEALKQADESRKAGKPMVLADTAGSNVKSMAGSVARAPGASKEIAQGFLNKRDAEAARRLESDVDKYLAMGSARQSVKSLASQRSVEGRPLFEKAYEGGSMAPLEKQFEKTFQEAADKTSSAQKELSKISPKITMLQAKLSQTNNVYEQAALRKKLVETQKEFSEKQAQIAQAKMEEAQAHQALQKAQTDKTSQAPGAVWNPRIQRLLDLPIVKNGIQQGIKLERQNSAADFRPFNAKEYAIVGEDKAGNPITGQVPNMRLLASAKEGLDAILDSKEMRDEFTGRLTKAGVSVDKVRRALLKEMTDINPAYRTALDSWAGHSQTMDAVRLGQKAFSSHPEELMEEIAQMSPSEKEFARIGLSDTIKEKIGKAGFNGDEAKAIIKNNWTQKQMRPFFNSDKEFNAFVKSVTDERSMFESKTAMVKGSQSAERLADDEENFGMAKKLGIGANLIRGHPVKAYQAMFEAWEASKFKNEKLNEAVAKLLFDPNISMDMLKQPVKLGEPGGIIKKSAPYVGQVIGQAMTNKPLPSSMGQPFNQFINQQ